MPQWLADRLLSWASELDPETRAQAERLARLPVVAGHVALMADAHLGMGSTVGAVIPTESAILPSAVGVDIGCGMCALRTDLRASDLPDSLDPVLDEYERHIPAGLGQGHQRDQDFGAWNAAARRRGVAPRTSFSSDQARRAARQFGTLGSGNHFLEVCLDEADRVWIVLHSGSRGIGNQLAQAHIERAKAGMRAAMVQLEDPDLAYFTQGTPQFDAYMADLLWAQEYAFGNRERMANVAAERLFSVVGSGRVDDVVNCLAAETEVITKHGVRRIDELSGGVHELLTTGGMWVKAPVRSFGRQPLMRILLSRSGATKVLYATPGHRWILRTRRGRIYEAATSDLRPGDRLAFSFPLKPAGTEVDREGAARGFVFGDGSRHGERARANFCGGKDRALLPLFEGWRAPRSYEDGKLVVIDGLPAAWKTSFPALDLPASYLSGWLAGYFAADGDVDKTGRPTLASANRANLEFVRDLCTQIGVGTFGIRERRRSGFGREATSLYLIGLMRGDLDEGFFLLPHHRERFVARSGGVAERRGWNVVEVIPTDRLEEVYCAVVDDTHAFSLEDNILTRNCHHNYTARERHQGRDLWITRKGAIRACHGDLGIIPGSMGTATYIVRGLGNEDSWTSCSHGAGRRMSRNRARKSFTVADLERLMAGKTWRSRMAAKLLDEIPGAYKDIETVMHDQRDLVETVHTLRQVLNYKGSN